MTGEQDAMGNVIKELMAGVDRLVVAHIVVHLEPKESSSCA